LPPLNRYAHLMIDGEARLAAAVELTGVVEFALRDGDVVAEILRTRVLHRGTGSEVWGWGTAYGKPTQTSSVAPAVEVKK